MMATLFEVAACCFHSNAFCNCTEFLWLLPPSGYQWCCGAHLPWSPYLQLSHRFNGGQGDVLTLVYLVVVPGFLLLRAHSQSLLIVAAQMLLESQFRLGTSVYITVPQASTQVDRSQGNERQSLPLGLSSTFTPFRLSETASPMPASWRPTDQQQAVLSGKRVVILDSSKFLVRGLCKLCEQVNDAKHLP